MNTHIKKYRLFDFIVITSFTWRYHWYLLEAMLRGKTFLSNVNICVSGLTVTIKSPSCTWKYSAGRNENTSFSKVSEDSKSKLYMRNEKDSTASQTLGSER